MPFTIETSGEDQFTVFARTFPKRADKALVRVLNRGGTTGRAVMARLISGETGIKVSDLKDDAIVLRKAFEGRLEVTVKASPRRLPLFDFRARQTKRGVTYKLAGSRHGGRHPHAFIATVGNGHQGVFVRTGKKRLPIKEVPGPSIGAVFKKHRPAGIAAAKESVEKNMAHELRYEMEQASA